MKNNTKVDMLRQENTTGKEGAWQDNIFWMFKKKGSKQGNFRDEI